MPRGYQVDPLTGQAAFRRGGLSWVPMTNPGALRPVTTFVPNVVAQQVPVTTMQPVQMTQQVPVTVNRFVDEVVNEQIPVQVTRFHDEVVTQQVPVEVTRMEQSEEIREVLLHSAVYCGVPAANGAFAIARRVLGDSSQGDD